MIAVVGIGFIFAVLLPVLHLSVMQKIAGLFQTPLLFRVFLVMRAAFVEETAFRGYGFERITEWTGSRTVAALFTLAHYSG